MSEYNCCCGSIHVKTGTTVIAILLAIGLVLRLVSGIANGHAGSLSSSIISLIIGGIVVACMFYGIHTQRGAFLIPYMVVQIISIVLFFILIIICIVAVASSGQFAHDFVNEWVISSKDIDAKVVAGILIAAILIYIAVQIWFLRVVHKCYVYFRERCG